MENWTEKELEARAFAIKAHGDQKYGDFVYEVHLSSVASLIKQMGYVESLVQAAWLHDVIEDTPWTLVGLQDQFDSQVVDLVWAVTNDIQGYTPYEKVKKAGEAAIVLKLCDRIANLEGCLLTRNKAKFEKYEKVYPDFRKQLKTEEYVYGSTRQLWSRLDYLVSEGWL